MSAVLPQPIAPGHGHDHEHDHAHGHPHGWRRWVLFAAAFLVVLGFHYYLKRLHTEFFHTKDFFFMNGADQLYLFQGHYVKLVGAVLVFGIICFVFGVLWEWKGNTDRWAFRAPLEIWAVLLFTAAMIAEVIWFSNNPMPLHWRSLA